MATRVTTEEARAFVLYELGRELPRIIRFDYVDNHLAAAVLFAAMGEPEQTHDIGKLHTVFRLRSPDPFFSGADKSRIRSDAETTFRYYEEDAHERLANGTSPTVLDGLQFSSANKWRFDDEPVTIYAVDSTGVVANVSNMGGFMELDDRNWGNIARSIGYGIRKEFGQDASQATDSM